MQIENTSIRLKQLMKERKLRQVDLLEMAKPFCEKYNVKMNKSDISQYLSGMVKPGQEKLAMLGMALNINEAWLMGYDSPKEKPHYIEALKLSDAEITLLKNYNKLNSLGKLEANKRVSELTEINIYIENTYDETSASKHNITELYVAEEHVEYNFAAHDDGLSPEKAKERIEKAKEIFKQMDEEE